MIWPIESPILEILDEWVISPLPHQTGIIKALNRNNARQFQLKREVREQCMNFTQAVESAKKGSKVRRSTWEADMFMWWGDNICVHSHPYNENQSISPIDEGYYYVMEKDDATATDWEFMRA